MAVHTDLSSEEAADRVALRELFDAYAPCADRRDAEGQKALFTDDTRFVVFMDGEGTEATYVVEGREALTPIFDDLNRYQVTTHFNGQSTVDIDSDRATGESYTIAHHLFTDDGEWANHDRLPSLPGQLREDRRCLVLPGAQPDPGLE